MKNIILGLAAVVVTVVGVAVVSKPVVNLTTPAPIVNVEAAKVNIPAPVVNVEAAKATAPVLGVASGPDQYFPVNFFAGFTRSNVFATTSTGAGTLTANNIIGRSTILSTNAGALTLTLPASTTLTSYVPKAGDTTEFVVVNQGTTLLTLAGGSGSLLQTASSTKTVNIGGSALINVVRKANSDIIFLMSPAI